MEIIVFDHCPVCSSDDTEVFCHLGKDARDRFAHLNRVKYERFFDEWEQKRSLELWHCLECGHIWHHTQPNQESLFRMYDASRPLKPVSKRLRPSPYILRQMRALFRMMASLGIRKPKLLDYGSGAGLWSRAAIAAGFTVSAYEPSKERSAATNSVSEFRVVNRVDEIRDEHFDVVNVEQVLEHTQKPVETLASLRAFCHSHTVLRISVPNIGPLKTRKDIWDDFPFNGKSIHIMSPYGHLQGFTPRSFMTALERSGLVRIAGWELISIYPFHGLREIVGRLIPGFQQTSAISRFARI